MPVIWYEFDKKSIKIRRERGTWGINVKTLGPGPYLLPADTMNCLHLQVEVR